MRIRNEEYDILVRAPLGQNTQCAWLPDGCCSNSSEFDLFFRDDGGYTFKMYNDICSRHLVIAIIEGISR